MVQRKGARYVKNSFSISPGPTELIKTLKWESLEQRRATSRVTAIYRSVIQEEAWREIGEMLREPTYIGRNDHTRKIQATQPRTEVGKFSLVADGIRLWNELPALVMSPFPKNAKEFRRRLKDNIQNNLKTNP